MSRILSSTRAKLRACVWLAEYEKKKMRKKHGIVDAQQAFISPSINNNKIRAAMCRSWGHSVFSGSLSIFSFFIHSSGHMTLTYKSLHIVYRLPLPSPMRIASFHPKNWASRIVFCFLLVFFFFSLSPLLFSCVLKFIFFFFSFWHMLRWTTRPSNNSSSRGKRSTTYEQDREKANKKKKKTQKYNAT